MPKTFDNFLFTLETTAQLRFAVGGLLIGFAKSNSPKARKVSESGRIIPFRQGV